jgi:hypothetical protein
MQDIDLLGISVDVQSQLEEDAQNNIVFSKTTLEFATFFGGEWEDTEDSQGTTYTTKEECAPEHCLALGGFSLGVFFFFLHLMDLLQRHIGFRNLLMPMFFQT